jgi:GNAT superfamily N-acetyltransferase
VLLVWSDFGAAERKAGDKKGSRGLPPLAEVRAALSRLAADPEQRLVLAELSGQLVGVAHLRRASISPIHTEDAVQVNYLHVLPQHRRRGIAHQLLEVAVAWAVEKDTEHVIATASTGSRDANRFLARLGLVPLATVRTGAVQSLSAKLAARDGATVVSTNVLMARRLMRRRAAREAANAAAASTVGWTDDPPEGPAHAVDGHLGDSAIG